MSSLDPGQWSDPKRKDEVVNKDHDHKDVTFASIAASSSKLLGHGTGFRGVAEGAHVATANARLAPTLHHINSGLRPKRSRNKTQRVSATSPLTLLRLLMRRAFLANPTDE